ncbi:predicted protein [Micromonas commoda]|uniref:J domain-containing protein n=1 Tax=Micromonas commoda (strain RCC299 / NOUM17 / CCMP2709) TaxID=296587 RepID=C1EBH8_MICCC|nr:predicted protein [Micromonas commoda]ACO65726.1 predicted protein [Micromonas commoda]|eukprot:XP_002504468.1 predicted protein [Micromonas commoda]
MFASSALVATQWAPPAGLTRARPARVRTERPRTSPREPHPLILSFRNDSHADFRAAHLCAPITPPQASRATAQPVVAGKAKKAAKAADKKAAKADKKAAAKQAPVSKQAKDAARKKAAAAMRDVVSRQGKAYDRIVKEMDRDEFREYILSVRHNSPEPVQQLCDWLPIAEVVVADKQAYEAKKFFRSVGSDIPETEQQAVGADQIEGVPAIKAKLPGMREEAVGMAYLMAGSVVKDVPFEELEFGVEDWGSFEMAVDAYEAQQSTSKRFAAAAATLGVAADDDPADVKRVYRKLIATEHPDRNPDSSLEKFNAIKEAYELLSDRGGQSGTTFEGLGDKAKRDFRKLSDVHAGVTSKGGELVEADVGSKVEVVMRSLTIYDRIKTMFIARNVSLGARKAEKTKASGKAAAEEETAVEEEVAAPEPVAA